MSTRSLFVAVFGLSVAAQSRASFEMLMQLDLMSGGFTGCIKRFDPVSGAYLGSFGTGYLNAPQSIQYKAGTLYVLDTVGSGYGAGRIHKFNPNTGEMLGTITLSSSWGKVNLGSGFVIDSGGNFYVSDAVQTAASSFVNKYTSTGAYVANAFWPPSGGNSLMGLALNEAANRIYVGNVSTSQFEVYDTTAHNTALQTVAAPGGPVFVNSNAGYLWYGPNTTGGFYRSAINSDGTLGAASSALMTGTTVYGLGFGHSPYGYAAASVGGQMGFTRFNVSTLDILGRFGVGQVTAPWGSSMVITAPEPASLLALGLGGIALLGRRRRR